MKKILVVDDISEYIDTLGVYLDSFEVLKAQSLKEAIGKIKEGIDVAIVDIRLDEKDPSNKEGLELVKYIKKRYPHLPVIVTSAYREFDYAVEALNIGADYFLKKPINPDELKMVLERVL